MKYTSHGRGTLRRQIQCSPGPSDLFLRDLRFKRQVGLPVSYKGMELSCGYRLDVVVQDTVAVELKAVERRLPIHEAQLLTYLRLSRKRVGLLINFNVAALKKGIVRRVL